MTDPSSLCLRPDADCPALQEIDSLREKILTLEQQVIRDPMTGLYNKRHFDSVLATEMERTKRTLQPTSLILADLDHFKNINDQYGHLVGDRVICRAAAVIKRLLRMIDVPCRYGGEEFAMVLPATPLSTAIQVAERVRSALKEAPLVIDGHTLNVSASFGVSCYRHEQRANAFSLVERADKQLYIAKRQGRDQVCAEIPDTTPSAVTSQERAALFEDAGDQSN